MITDIMGKKRKKVESWPFPENDQRHKGNQTEGNRHAQPQRD